MDNIFFIYLKVPCFSSTRNHWLISPPPSPTRRTECRAGRQWGVSQPGMEPATSQSQDGHSATRHTAVAGSPEDGTPVARFRMEVDSGDHWILSRHTGTNVTGTSPAVW